MKHASEWDEEYLLNLPAYEPNHIEFKGRKSLDLTLPNVKVDDVKETLSKALSAFANSGGGLIIYGIKNPQPNKPLLVDDGGIPLSIKGRQSTKEWLEDVIPYLTDFPISDFHIYPIERKTDDSQIAEGHAVFIVEVPNSERAPHQANDNKYYIRAGGKSQPIGHQLVLDIMGRRQHPIMELELYTQSNLEYRDEIHWREGTFKMEGRTLSLNVTLTNIGQVYAKYVTCYIFVPLLKTGFINEDLFPTKEIGGNLYRVHLCDNTNRDVIKGDELMYKIGIEKNVEFGPSWFYPILPGMSRKWKFTLSENLNPLKAYRELLWEIYADNAPVKKGSLNFRIIEHRDANNIII